MTEETIALRKGRRVQIECGLKVDIPYSDNSSGTITIQRNRQFKYDSGSQITCIPASILDLKMKEEDFIKWSNDHRTEGIPPFSVFCTGIDSLSDGIRFHYIQTNSFHIRNIDLGSVPIYITFDPRYRKLLLGMDLLRLMNIQQDVDANELRMQIAEKVKDYKNSHLRLTVKSMYELGIYSKDDGNIDVSHILSSAT